MGKKQLSFAKIEQDPIKKEVSRCIVDSLLKLANDLPQSPPLDQTALTSDVYAMLASPPEKELGDYALPCFKTAGMVKCKPPELASKLDALLQTQIKENTQHPIFQTSAAGPFLNIKLNNAFLTNTVLTHVAQKSYTNRLNELLTPFRKKYMVEFSQPNTHKEFHVGHLRNVCLGESIVRLYKFLGFETIPVNYPGDEGTHIAKCLWKAAPIWDQAPSSDKSIWLGKLYTKASIELKDLEQAAKNDSDAQKTYQQARDQISEILAQIEAKQGPFYQKWLESREWCLDDFSKIYNWLDVHFDHYFFESEVSEYSQEIVEEYLEKGLFKEDDGAIGIDLKDYKLGFLIVRKSDGNTLYATKDLALASTKFEKYNIDRSIYVVADEQIHHFKQVFKTLELMGFEQAKNCFHLSYGMVVLSSGKMSSRSGNVVTFHSLRQDMLKALEPFFEKYENEWSSADIIEAKRKVCGAAMKYSMLMSDPVKKITFDPDQAVSFEGNTGPYLLYSYARARSILRKAKQSGIQTQWNMPFQLEHTHEAALTKAMNDCYQHALNAAEQFKPSLLAQHLYELCKEFNRFYKDVSILKEDDENLRTQRLQMVDLYTQMLGQMLGLLGIETIEQM